MNDEDFDYEQAVRDLIDAFVADGAMELIGIDDDGEFIYRMTPLMQEKYPEAYEEYLAATNSIVQQLWEKELIDVVASVDGNFGIFLNENSMNYKDFNLDDDERLMMEEIIRMMA